MPTITAKRKTATKPVAKGKIIEYTFEGGVKFAGTFEQLQKVATTLGMKISGVSVPRGYYDSESKGIVKISTMNDFHLRNALVKRTREYYAGIYSASDTNKQFLDKFHGLVDDQIVSDLHLELSKRK